MPVSLKGKLTGIVVTTLLCLLVLPPLFMLVQSGLAAHGPQNAGELTLDNFRRILTGHELFRSGFNSIIFAVMTTAVALVFGGILAWLVERTDVPMKWLAYVTTIISLGTPYVLYVSAWLYLLGRGGPFNDFWRSFIQPGANPFNIHTITGMAVVEGFLWSPLVFLLLSSTFRAANADMEEAARMSGATVLGAIRRVALPLAWPAVSALAIFIFIRSIESFEVPILVGMPGGINVLTTEIYRRLDSAPPDLGYASAFSMILIIFLAVLLWFYGNISKKAERYASITGKSFRPRQLRLGGLRWIGGGVILFNFLIILALPLLAMLWMAITPFTRPMRLAGMQNLSMDRFAAVLSDGYYYQLAGNTLLVAALVATVTMGFTFFCGWLTARRQFGGRALEQLTSMTLVFPGLVLGVAVLQIGLALPVPVYGTLWLIGLGFMIRYLPYGMRYSFGGVLQIQNELEHAAEVAGASRGQVMSRVVGPLMLPSLASGWLFIFLLASKEMTLPLLLSGPNSKLVSVAMFDLLNNGQAGAVAALGLLWSGLMTVIAVGFYFLSRRQSQSTFGA